MGRAKLQMKKIESIIKRQVTFSKRRNGLIKKAYEISVLCDVDVLLIMFSPSHKLSWFSGNKKRVEDILVRFVSLPEHDRGRLPDEERFLRIVKNLNNQSEASAKLARHKRSNFKCHFEKHQNEFMLLQNELAEAEKQLKVFEEGVYKITTIYDAEHYQRILKETLSLVQVRKKILEEKIIVPSIKMHPQELCAHTLYYPQPRNANANVLYARGVNHVFDCAHQQVAQFQTNHVFGSVGLLPMSYQKQPAIDFTTLEQRNEFQLQEHLNGYVLSSSTATSKISLAKVTTTAKSGDDEHSSSQTLFPM